jgi:hypothetical protein
VTLIIAHHQANNISLQIVKTKEEEKRIVDVFQDTLGRTADKLACPHVRSILHVSK